MERPVFTAELPSKGLLYNGKIPATLTLHPMRAKEEKMLAGATTTVASINALSAMIRACIRDQVDVNELAVADRFFLLLMLRIQSYGPFYTFNVTCPECDHRFKEKTNLDEALDVKPLRDDVVEPFTVDLPDTDVEVGLRFLRGKDEVDVAKAAMRVKDEYGDPSFFLRLEKHIVTIDGKEPSLADKKLFVENLSIRDQDAIERALDDADFGLDTKLTLSCPKCEHTWELYLPLQAGFFRLTR